MILCIALVEIHHLHLIGEMIESLGGDPKFLRTNHLFWTGGYIEYGENTCEKISDDIFAEQETITGYDAMVRTISRENGPGSQQVIQVMNRINAYGSP